MAAATGPDVVLYAFAAKKISLHSSSGFSGIFEKNLFHGLNDGYYRAIRKSILLRSTFAPGLELVGFVCFALALFLIDKGHFGAEFGPEGLIQFLAALGVMLRPLKSLGEQMARFQETKGALKEGYALFDSIEEDSRKKFEDKQKVQVCDIESLQAGYDGEVKFRGNNLSLQVGKSIAIVGPSGAGKSTLMRAMVGLLKAMTWKSKTTEQKFFDHISFVSQNPFLFQDSLRRNLCYGLQRDCDDQEILASLERVGMLDAIKELPNGLDTTVEAVRSNFSGGQVQRLVIARSLLRKQEFLAFDEATSAIDADNEELITKYLLTEVAAKSIGLIFITHRLTWLELFDEIWFVENGEIQLMGSHSQLLKEDRYRRFYESQEI